MIHEGAAFLLGDPVARLDTVDLHLALEAVLGRLAMSQPPNRACRRRAPTPEDIAAAKADLTLAEARWTAAERDRERAQSLFDSGSRNRECEDAGTRSEIAAARPDGHGSGGVASSLGSQVEEIEAARARLRSAEARAAELRRAIDEASIESAVRVLTQRARGTGRDLGAGHTDRARDEARPASIVAWVSGPDLDHVRLGDSVELRTDGGEVARSVVSSIETEGRVHAEERADPRRARSIGVPRSASRRPIRMASGNPSLPVKPTFSIGATDVCRRVTSLRALGQNRRRVALDGLCLESAEENVQVDQPRLVAGKTTTIRLVLGLLHPTQDPFSRSDSIHRGARRRIARQRGLPLAANFRSTAI